ncbi:MAG: hypothetical protein KGY56_10890 [Desulfobacterales bacterium]|nr:hypothetical protein [Desulfobacterales bacterium]
MKTDMHYFGVYALARAAGMREKPAEIIATASEYVDGAIWDKEVFLEDGRSILAEMTAHKMLDFKNADREDQRRVWLPFHFLPGAEGKTPTDKLLCRENSRIAKTMVRRNTAIAAEAPYGLHLMGITAHVFADTFAHYGFMGANHSYNAIRAGSIDLQVSDDGILDYIQKKAKGFINKLVSYGLSQAFPLGHAAATTYPDRPYLRWSYVRASDGKTVERENPKDYLAGCKAMHEMFQAYLDKAPRQGASGVGRKWKDIRKSVKKIIELEGDKQARVRAWKAAIRDNQLFGGSTRVPQYKGPKWSASIDDLEPEKIPKDMDKLPVYRFYQAARIHRAHVLSNLLPPNDVIAA